MRTAVSWLVLAVLVATGLAGCASADPDDSLVDRAAAADTLTIGIRYDQPGLSEHTLDGRFVGFDVDVARYVAGQLGVPEDGITWRESTSASRENDLVSGAVDLIVATYSITEPRRQQVGFAGPYFVSGQDLLVRRTATDITGPASLAGKRLCSVTGSTAAAAVRDRFAATVQLAEYPRYPDCVTALLAGQVDAVTTDGIILAGYVTQNPELLRVVGAPFSQERYGIGLRRGDTDGQQAVNDALRSMISSGAWAAALRADLGASGYPLPGPPEVTEG